MKRVALMMVLAVAACGQSERSVEQPAVVASEAEVAPAEQQQVQSAVPSKEELQAARSTVQRWQEELLQKEAYLLDAHKSGEADTVSRLSLNWGNGAPGTDEEWRSEAYAPYIKCDTAWVDLGILANALSVDLKGSTATTRTIINQEKADYRRSKSLCENRLKLEPEKAWEAYKQE